MRLRLLATALVAVALVSAACSGDGEPKTTPSELPRRSLPVPEDQPYVSVAVDNHFHDVHADDGITISVDRVFMIRNEGRNLHNVTIPAIDFSKDIRPGEKVRFAPAGDELPPGTYSIICRYHSSEGMVGEITISAD